MIPQSERPRVQSPTNPTLVLQVVVPLVCLHVGPHRIQGRKRPITLRTRKRLDVAILMPRQLDAGFKSLRTIRTLISPHIRMRQQMMVIHTMRLKPLPAMFALVRPGPRMRPQVQRQAITHPKSLAADLAHVWLLPRMYPFVLDLLVRPRESPAAVLASVRPLLALILQMLVQSIVRHERLLTIRTSKLFIVSVSLHVHF